MAKPGARSCQLTVSLARTSLVLVIPCIMNEYRDVIDRLFLRSERPCASVGHHVLHQQSPYSCQGHFKPASRQGWAKCKEV